MIKERTVFVLGAGASWHYGYPTGEELVTKIIEAAERFANYCDHRVNSGQTIQVIPKYVERHFGAAGGGGAAIHGWSKVKEECKLLIERLQAVQPILIDHFLAWNESLRPIGRMMIAAAILECEAAKVVRKGWYRYIVHKLVYGCAQSADLFKNDMRFISFNYEASLEYHLFKALRSIDIIKPDDARQFITVDRIVHPYGCVHTDIPSDEDFIDITVAKTLGEKFSTPLSFAKDFEPRQVFLDRCLAASENLKTIDPHDKEQDDASLARAQQWIRDAGVIYILGYGFDANNNRRVGLWPTIKEASAKVVMFTNFGDMNTINRKASSLLLGDYGHFSNLIPVGHPTGRYFEKSVRDVYDAFGQDFHALEGELTGSTPI